MGKGTITSGGEQGQYTVQINYNRTDYLTIIAKLEAKIIAITAKIAALPPETPKEQLSLLKLTKLAYEKSKSYYEKSMPSDRSMPLWCADLTEDLTGEVGTIEVTGESNYIQLQPGYDGNAVYDSARDGQLLPIVMTTPSQAFYNFAMLPGWQKWKPLFRYGRITAISEGEAVIELENIKSSQLDLGINQSETLSGVKAEYMTCNMAAFEVDDDVLIKFTGQDWSNPVIIGFKEEPKSCNAPFLLKPKFNGSFAAKGGQYIMLSYFYESQKYIWLKVYGSEHTPPSDAALQCTKIVNMDKDERYAFDATVEIFLQGKNVPFYQSDTAAGATFTMFYELFGEDIPEDHSVIDTYVADTVIGTGDGTTSPALGAFMPEYGFSRWEYYGMSVHATSISDVSISCTLDCFGFLTGSNPHVVNDPHLNVSTGVWDTPIEWDVNIKTGTSITINYYKRAPLDLSMVSGGSSHYYRQVDFKPSNTDFTTSTVGREIVNGVEYDAFEIEFNDLYLLKRTPDAMVAANQVPACQAGILIDDYQLWNSSAAEITYGGVEFWPLSSGVARKYHLGEQIDFLETTGWVTTFGNLPELNPACDYEREMELLESPGTTYPRCIVCDDANGSGPSFNSFTIRIKELIPILSVGYFPDDPRGGCNCNAYCEERQDDPDGWVPEGTCACRYFSWLYEMVETPDTAF